MENGPFLDFVNEIELSRLPDFLLLDSKNYFIL
jgi:hypothetical protein